MLGVALLEQGVEAVEYLPAIPVVAVCGAVQPLRVGAVHQEAARRGGIAPAAVPGADIERSYLTGAPRDIESPPGHRMNEDVLEGQPADPEAARVKADALHIRCRWQAGALDHDVEHVLL